MSRRVRTMASAKLSTKSVVLGQCRTGRKGCNRSRLAGAYHFHHLASDRGLRCGYTLVPDTAISAEDQYFTLAVTGSRVDLLQNELLHRFGETLVLVAVGDCARLGFHLVAGVAHGNGKAAFAEHGDVIRHVPHGGDLGGWNF